MAEISREELWDLIKQFVNASAWKNNGYVTKVMTSYRSIHLSGSYRGYTAWLCFIYPGQEIKNGIYISVYINRTKNGRFFNINNVEICYATSECVKAKLQWNKDAYPTSISFTYPQSRCPQARPCVPACYPRSVARCDPDRGHSTHPSSPNSAPISHSSSPCGA